MCGLVALIDQNRPIDLSILPSIFHSMQHRGPDDEHYYAEPGALLCHSRLAIESAEGDKQPITSVCGRYTIAVNGELYPHRELHQQLLQQGYTFQTQSDSEIALALYLKYGEDFVLHLRGEFVILLWDTLKQELLVVRDRFGIKPLVYGQQKGRWYFGSEAKSLFAAGFNASWSLPGLAQCLSYQYLSPAESLFGGLQQLPPAHMLKLSNGTARVTRYWEMTFSQSGQSPIVTPDEILECLNEAIRIRLSQNKQCVFSLSGGLDSSATVALASKYLNRPAVCYSVSFDESRFDEYPQAKSYTSAMGYTHHKVNVSRSDLIEHIDKAAYFCEGLASNGQYVGKFLLNKAIAKNGHQVILSGEGADEAFMGYAHLLQDYANSELTGEAQQQALTHIGQVHQLQKGLMLSTNKKNDSVFIPSFLAAKFQFCQQFPPLFKEEFNQLFQQAKAKQELLNKLDSPTSSPLLTPVQKSNKLWTEMVLSNYILKTLGDGMEMAFSIEGRLPFLDHTVFELGIKLDTQQKLDRKTTKKALRECLKNKLPHNIVNREKHPFIAPPISGGISTNLMEKIFDQLSTQTFRYNPVFCPEKTQQWLQQWRHATPEVQKTMDPVLMTLLSFSALNKHFSLNHID
ncbi:asparagine synthase (glutamine-hydrolyzing) [Teredinibacter sp. KSP-S5-2]|uniref:asparagine synthase (glutamine-hydrolyzing) n=1 Tax=Teredinibacter sp. KSP-S5-2 TaxID=3034506 RepID=UPI00293513DB|nr:asparagine synthase (glutamine-hydrolyzing) [Teredinibacter sp. KSP-S5-2]WNO10856.1 asparagine synthase (glutamine-hydrolyzing) [Teredinibacter sp. KSP-S5-2]